MPDAGPRDRFAAVATPLAALGLGTAVVGLVVLAVLSLGGGPPPPSPGALVPLDGRSPRVPAAERVRVLVGLARPSLGERLARERLPPAEQVSYVRSLEREASALLSALRAKGVAVANAVRFARAWNGFAITIASDDLTRVETLGTRIEPVRRFYPASTTVPRIAAGPAAPARPDPGAPPPALALLDGAVDTRDPALAGRVVTGAVAGDPVGPASGEPAPANALARALVAALAPRERVLAVPVGRRERDPATALVAEAATTDRLLAGLERAVDPDGDGATDDHVRVAVVGVNAPYAGFDDAPEDQAVTAASEIGTLVVAPAGAEGPRAGSFGTIGSPAAADRAVAVAAMAGGGRSVVRHEVELGLSGPGGRLRTRGLLLGGRGGRRRATAVGLRSPSQADADTPGGGSPARAGGGRRTVRRLLGGDPREFFGLDARPRARGAVVVVPATGAGAEAPPLAARAAAASAAGAAALVICRPDGGPLLPLMRSGAGGLPVVGLRGEPARRALELTAASDGLAFLSAPRRRVEEGTGSSRPAAASSRGPTYGLVAKPDLAADALDASGLAGPAVAAARAGATALALARSRPRDPPDRLAAALMATAEAAAGGPLASGAGRPAVARAAAPIALTEPSRLNLRLPAAPEGGRPGRTAEARAGLRLLNPGRRPVRFAVSAVGLPRTVRVRRGPPGVRLAAGESRRIEIRVRARGLEEPVAGRLLVRAAAARPSGREAVQVPVLVSPPPPAPALGPLRPVAEAGAVSGVRFAVGRVVRRGTRVGPEPLGRLRLELQRASGEPVRELTPPGGALDLLPGEYAYTLTDEVAGGLGAGRYRFEARARGPAGGPEVRRRTGPFRPTSEDPTR